MNMINPGIVSNSCCEELSSWSQILTFWNFNDDPETNTLQEIFKIPSKSHHLHPSSPSPALALIDAGDESNEGKPSERERITEKIDTCAKCKRKMPEQAPKELRKKMNNRCRKRRRSSELHKKSEKKRRDREREKFQNLLQLMPNCRKWDRNSVLDHSIKYLKDLKLHTDMMSMGYPGPFMSQTVAQSTQCSAVPQLLPPGIRVRCSAASDVVLMPTAVNLAPGQTQIPMIAFQSPNPQAPAFSNMLHGGTGTRSGSESSTGRQPVRTQK